MRPRQSAIEPGISLAGPDFDYNLLRLYAFHTHFFKIPPMHRCSILLVSLLAFPPLLAVAEQIPSGYTPLFDGESLAGWHGRPHLNPAELAALPEAERAQQLDEWMTGVKQHWRVEQGELVNDGAGPYLVTDKAYRDYDLVLDFKISAGADSGVYLKNTPQVQIWDFTDESKFRHQADLGSGGLWNNAAGSPGKNPSELADNPIGQWNTMRMRQIGSRTWVWLNGKQVVDGAIMANYWDRDAPLPATGNIQLQTHGGEIRWRNLAIRELSAEAANEILRESVDGDFVSLFNGTDLSGWQGAVDHYEVADGAIRCKSGKGGNLLTAEEYADFVVQLEFRLPPGGNNGLAIRAPLTGNPAYVAMTELQVLDNTAEQYAQLDPRQYHGSAYGMAAAHRGYLRQPGEWNFQVVTVQGSQIKVELNGSLILDTDLSEISEMMDDREHPGKDRDRGYFGFAGHNDPVEFRNIAVRTLE